jgi:hypothetical protein
VTAMTTAATAIAVTAGAAPVARRANYTYPDWYVRLVASKARPCIFTTCTEQHAAGEECLAKKAHLRAYTCATLKCAAPRVKGLIACARHAEG